MRRRLGPKSYVVFFLVVVVGTLGTLFYYNYNLRQRLSNATQNTLEEITQQQKFNLNSELGAEVMSIKTLAVSMNYLESDKENVLTAIDHLVSETEFLHILVVNNDGIGIASTGATVDVSAFEYFKRAVTGETVITDPIRSVVTRGEVIALATPILMDNALKGVLVGAYKADLLNNLLLPSYEGRGYAFVVNGAGDIIAKTANDYVITQQGNLFESWAEAEFGESSLGEVIDAVKQRNSGHISYKIMSQVRLAY